MCGAVAGVSLCAKSLYEPVYFLPFYPSTIRLLDVGRFLSIIRGVYPLARDCEGTAHGLNKLEKPGCTALPLTPCPTVSHIGLNLYLSSRSSLSRLSQGTEPNTPTAATARGPVGQSTEGFHPSFHHILAYSDREYHTLSLTQKELRQKHTARD